MKIGDLEKNSDTIKVVGANFNEERFTDAAFRVGVGDLKFGEGEEGMQRSFINTATVEAGRWETTTCGRRLARKLPSHRQGRRERAERENSYRQFEEMTKGSRCPTSEWKE